VGAELFHADMTKLIVAFHKFANVPKYNQGMGLGGERALGQVRNNTQALQVPPVSKFMSV
jgi:hypothetical protein